MCWGSPSWDGMPEAMLAAPAQASQEGRGRAGRWLGASLGPFQWQWEQMAGSLLPEASPQPSCASTHPKTTVLSAVSVSLCTVVGAAGLPQGGVGAIFGLWEPFGKSKHGLKGLRLRRGTWLLQGSSCLKGSALTPPFPRPHPASQPWPLPALHVAQGKDMSLFAVGNTGTQLLPRAQG